jgi:outer membrane assembly lipoprotein YfiO
MPIPRATVQPPAPLADEPAPAAPENSSARTPWWRWWERTDDGSADRTLFAQGMAAYEQGSLGTAIRRLKKLIKDHPTSRYREEAIWRAADAYFQQKEYYKAYEQYENLLTQYAGSAYYRDGLLREIEIADLFLGPVRRRVLGVPLLSGETEAIEILRRVYEHQPAGDLADDVVLKIADYYWAKSRWPESEDYYDKYCREYPNGESVLYAELQRAKCTIERCRGPLYDTTCLQLAYDRLQAFQQKYPNEGWQQGVPELMLAVRDTQAEAMYRIAERYLRGGEPLAAAFYAERLRGKFADSPWSDRAAAFLIDAPLTQEPNP